MCLYRTYQLLGIEIEDVTQSKPGKAPKRWSCGEPGTYNPTLLLSSNISRSGEGYELVAVGVGYEVVAVEQGTSMG